MDESKISSIKSIAFVPMTITSICYVINQSFIQKLSQLLMGSGMFKNLMDKEKKPEIIIGAYSYRGHIHACRLLCQYMGVHYKNQFFDPYTWQVFKKQQTQDWIFSELPFLQDGDFILTDVHPICQYVIKREGNQELLGKTLDDQLEVDKFLYGKSLTQGFLSLIIEYKDKLNKLYENANEIWIKNIGPLLEEYEKNAKQNAFYLGYLSIIDFFISEMVDLMLKMYSEKMQRFPKLLAIKKAFQNIPEIRQYENSDRTVKNYCPLEFFEKWKYAALSKK